MVKEAALTASGHPGERVLKLYLEDIRRARQVPYRDEAALFRSMRQGNPRAREGLISGNMRFVVKVALEFRACPMPVADLISEGALGLIHAVETFDPDRGVKFISYAVWWIRSHITKALNEKGYLIRLPANQYFRLRKALQAEKHGSLAEEDLRVIRQLSQGCASLNAEHPGRGRAGSDMLADPGARDPSVQAELALGRGLTDRILDSLSVRERKVVRDIYGLGNENPATLKEVGRDLGLSSERVRQIRKQAITKMRQNPAAAPLRDRYLGLLEDRHG